MAESDPYSPDDESVAESAVNRVAALDDYLGGFTAATSIGTDSVAEHDTADGDALDEAELVDTILLLRQTAAAEGIVPTGLPMPAPARIGRYAVVRLAGTGGFATVWEGFDSVLRRPVAVKVRRPELLLSENVRRRFVREAELAARLAHPHIVATFEVGDDDGREFIATEFCSAGSLADWLEQHPGPCPPPVAARVLRALAGATACAHASGVIHRDIKPANILLLPAPVGSDALIPTAVDDAGAAAGLTVKLGDFGLGMIREGFEENDPLSRLTRSGTNVGTPAWMAPEQIDRDFGAVGPATDVHALGLVLDRMLTGRMLRGGGTDAETYRKVLLDEPVAANRVVRGVPRDLAAIAMKCLAKRPSDRYPSAAALADDLERWMDGRPTLARPLAPAARAFRSMRQRPLLVALTAAAIAAMLVAVWAGVERGREADRAAAHAVDLRRRQAVAELQRGFEAMRSGNVASALEQLSTTRAIDPSLANSLAGRWLLRRTHGEREMLMQPRPRAAADKRPQDLYALALAPDSRSAAVGAADGTVRLVRGLDGNPSITSVPAHDEVNEVCWSPDGAMLASAGQNGVLRWWSVTPQGLVPVGEVNSHGGPLYGAAFAPDGATIAFGGEDRTIRLVRLDEPGHLIELFTFDRPAGRESEVESLEFVDDATLAVCCGDRVVLLDTATGRVTCEPERMGRETGPTTFGSIVVSPDRTRVLACGSNTTAQIWDIATGRLSLTLPLHPHWVHGAAFSHDGSQIATACRDGGLRVFDAKTGVLLRRFFGHAGRVWSVAFEPSGTLLTAGADGTIRRWDPTRSPDAEIFRETPLPALEIAILTPGIPSPGGEPCPILASDRRKLWHIEPGARSARPFLPAEVSDPEWYAVDHERRRVAVSRKPETSIAVYSHVASHPVTTTGVDTLPHANTAAANLAWAPTGELIIHTRDGRLFWCSADLQSPRLLGTGTCAANAIAIAPTGPPRVAVAGDESFIQALPTSRNSRSPVWAPVVLPMSGATNTIAWSPDGSLVACAMRSGGVHLFDGTTGTPRGTFTPHEYPIEAIAFAGDGRTLVAVDGHCIRFYDVPTLATLDEFRPGWHMRTALLSEAGDRIVIGGNEPNKSNGRLAVADLPSH